MEQGTKTEDRVWVPLDELETWMRNLSSALMSIIGNIEVTIDKMNEDVATQKSQDEGDDNDDDN